MSELLTHFTKHELAAIYGTVLTKRTSLANNNCFGDDYDELGSILKKIEVSQENASRS
jgi:hypothetical protein